MSINPLTGDLITGQDDSSAPYGMTQIAGKFLVTQDKDLQKGISNRYGHHKRLVRKSQLRDKV